MKALITNGSKLLEGPLGNVRIGFNGWDMGLTTEDTALVKEEDRKDILYSQTGTKAADHISTGQNLLLNCVFGEIKTQLLAQILYSFQTQASTDGL
jgi:hypothetical protein